MMSSLAVEIREWLARYLAEEVGLSEFWEWLMPQTWDIGPDVDQAMADLAYGAQLLLFEFSDGLWTEAELRDRLRLIAPDYQATLDATPVSSGLTTHVSMQTGSSATTITGGVRGQHLAADAQRATASA